MKIAPAFTVRSVLVNFGPWIVYGFLSALGQAKWAYGGGLIVSLFQVIPQWRARRLKTLDGVTALFFLVGAVSTFLLHSSVFPDNNSLLIWTTFALVAWGSLLAGSPFTAQYARDAVPREYWGSPVFCRANAVITAVWGGVFVVNAALAAATKLGGHAGLWLPVLPCVGTVFGVVFTNRYPQWVRQQGQESNLLDSEEIKKEQL